MAAQLYYGLNTLLPADVERGELTPTSGLLGRKPVLHAHCFLKRDLLGAHIHILLSKWLRATARWEVTLTKPTASKGSRANGAF